MIMRAFIMMMLLLFSWTAALPAPPEAPKGQPKSVLDGVLKGRDKRLVCVIFQGQFFHRHDHLVVYGTESITPEAAVARGYDPCPECGPPPSSQTLAKESASAANLEPYYSTYLTERVKPAAAASSFGGSISGGLAGPGSVPGANLLGGFGQGLGTATAISGAYSQTMLR